MSSKASNEVNLAPAGGRPPELPSAPVAHKRWMPTQPLVFALVVGVSGAMLFTMRQMGMRSAIAFEGHQFGEEIRDDSAQRARYQKIMADLTSVQDPLDIALVDFGKSPFSVRNPPKAQQIAQAQPQIVPTAPATSPEELEARRLQAEKAALLAEVSKLTVHSVMGGRKPIARINDETVRIGDMVAEKFVVVGIEGRSVTLKAGPESFTITMEDFGSKGGKK
jgi:hypothetical protein